MAEDELLTNLPAEIVEFILESQNLSIQDALNVGKTCKLLNRVVTISNKLWKAKFFQRWPILKDAYADYEKHGKVQNWYKETKANVTVRQCLKRQLALMSPKYYKKQELSHSEFKEFDPLFQETDGAHPMGYHFVVDELINIINQSTLECNLTIRYYAFKVVRYTKQQYLAKVWQDYIELPQKKQILEIGATIVAQWSQPEKRVAYSDICKKLDDIVEQAKDLLRERHPKHPVFSTPQETLDYWKSNNIDDNQYPMNETSQIMSALGEVMFKKLGFHGNSEMYYSSENSFIDKVLELKQGIPITLAIVYESICRRVGVKCEYINFPAHFLLRWREKYVNPNDEDVENFYIDVFNGGQFMTRQNCPRLGGASKCPIERYNIQNASSAKEVVERMANNLEVASRQRTRLNGRAARLRSALELLHLVRPHDTGAILHLARFYMLYQMDLTKLVQILTFIKTDPGSQSRGQANHILQMLQDYEKHVNEEDSIVKKRIPDVKYAVGMIMKHQKYHYMCVITGWDMVCEASPEWMLEMGVDELRSGANQPFYNVFVEDGSSRYAAQENLQMAEITGWINHYETGRYFSEFKITHYVPNEEKAKEYPEDAEIREQLLSKYM